MNQQNDMRRYVMQAIQQHGGLSPRFANLLQAMQGQQQPMTAPSNKPVDPLAGMNPHAAAQVAAQRRQQVNAIPHATGNIASGTFDLYCERN